MGTGQGGCRRCLGEETALKSPQTPWEEVEQPPAALWLR